MLRPSPFAGLGKSDSKRLEQAFLQAFVICVETDDDGEELWAYEQLKALYAEAPMTDTVASFFEAMSWASQVGFREGLYS